jgi:hypothetical protein
MPQFDTETIQVMRGVLDDVMSRVPLEFSGTTAKAYLAAAILKAAAQGHTSYNELMAVATDQIQTILSILTMQREVVQAIGVDQRQNRFRG